MFLAGIDIDNNVVLNLFNPALDIIVHQMKNVNIYEQLQMFYLWKFIDNK